MSSIPFAAKNFSVDRRQYGDAFWRSLFYFNVYRLGAALVLLAAILALGSEVPFGSNSRQAYLYSNVCYIVFSVMAFGAVLSRRPYFTGQLAVQICADILFLTTMMHFSGGISSGLGLLLLVSLAAVGLISRGRLTLFFAALATIAILGEHTYQVVFLDASIAQYAQAGLLSIGFFATGWLAHSLAKRAVAIEAIAAQREVDLANLAQVNQLVIQDMLDGVLVVDERGVIRQINSRAEAILGPLRRSNREILLQDYAPILAARLEQWRRDPGAGFNPLRTVQTHKPTAARFVQAGISRNVGVVIFLEDLTRVQQQAQQLKLASLGRLTANIAHEIRNPLSAINHATELLLEESALSGSSHARMLQIIHDNSQRLDRMVQDVLKLNRRDRAVHEHFDLGDYLETFAAEFCEIEKVPADTIRVEMHVECTIYFDRSHLNQVMWNLCRNALRYCQKKTGSIMVNVRSGPRQGTVELSVIDDGMGIAESLRGHLFEPFFTTASSGTGLGLYIAREICEANAATLDYVERPLGAQFSLVCRGVTA
ncbi:MAG: two-component system sensor histidine kinase NtrB [Burkholderiales bacterium]|jgi:two-component system sensor histidine kinase PilS (NtrC family)